MDEKKGINTRYFVTKHNEGGRVRHNILDKINTAYITVMQLLMRKRHDLMLTLSAVEGKVYTRDLFRRD